MAAPMTPEAAWSTWEIAVTLLGSGGFMGAMIAIVGFIWRGGRNEAIAKRVKDDLEKYRQDAEMKFNASDAKVERQVGALDAKMEIIRSDMATRHDLDRLGALIMDSFRTSIAALGANFRQRD
jgi:hypothetical protein